MWPLVDLLDDIKTIEGKWIYKTKRDSKGNVKRFKGKHVAKSSLNEKQLILMLPFWMYPAKII